MTYFSAKIYLFCSRMRERRVSSALLLVPVVNEKADFQAYPGFLSCWHNYARQRAEKGENELICRNSMPCGSTHVVGGCGRLSLVLRTGLFRAILCFLQFTWTFLISLLFATLRGTSKATADDASNVVVSKLRSNVLKAWPLFRYNVSFFMSGFVSPIFLARFFFSSMLLSYFRKRVLGQIGFT